MTKKILHSKIMIIIILIFALLLPQTINMPKQIDLRAFVIAVGVDKTDDGTNYVLSTQVVVPEPSLSFGENLQVYSAEGKNMIECIEHLSLHIGKIAGLGNVSVVVFGNDVAVDGINDSLDFFLRSKRLNDNATVMTTDKKAKDLLSSVAKIDKNFGYSLNGIARMNSESLITRATNLENFLNDFYNNTATFVSQVRLESDDNMGIDSSKSGGQASGGQDTSTVSATQSKNTSSSDTAESEQTVVSNSGYTSVFFKGKQVEVFEPEQMKGFNNLLGIMRGVYTVENVCDNNFDNATVAMSVKKEHVSKSLEFKNGIPQVKYHLKYSLKVEQILQNGTEQIILDGNKNYVTTAVVNKFRDLVKSQIASSINLEKYYNLDLLSTMLDYKRFRHNDWNNFIKTLPDKENALSKIEFFVDVEAKGNV